ncbi:MAG TPA: 50S ribosomal protein L10 [Firmicutes bacterium]|nr:50S ribosomal protein L10 [Bacillota bacterium]
MNPKTLEAKKARVAELKERLQTANCVLILTYQGLDVKTFTKLREALHHVEADGKPVKAGVEVRKNTLVKRAIEEVNDKELEGLLTGANALITCDDPLACLKAVTEFCEKNSKFAKIKGGLIEHVFMNQEKLDVIGACGSRNGIYSMLLSVLEAGMRNLAVDVKMIAEKKQAEQPAA